MPQVPHSNNYSNNLRADEEDRAQRMEFDRQDAEVGSILIALANHPTTAATTTTAAAAAAAPTTATLAESHAPSHGQGSMSIQNLLGHSNDSSTSTAIVNNDIHERRNSVGVLGPRPSATTTTTTTTFARMQPPLVLEKSPLPFSAASHHSYPARHQIHSRHASSGGGGGGGGSSSSNSKIKRNALHAYISYMIYTDLAATAAAATTTNATGTAAAIVNNTNQHHKTSFERRDLTPISTSRRMTNPFEPALLLHEDRDTIIHRPLTAYLRQDTSSEHPTFDSRSYNSTPLLPRYLHPENNNM